MIILLVSHILGDYYLQNDYIAIHKCRSFKMMMIHLAYVFLVNLFLLAIFYSVSGIIPAILITFIHLIIDVVSSGILGFRLSKNKLVNHIFDQLLHLLSIIIVFLVFLNQIVYSIWIINFLSINAMTSFTIEVIILITCILYLLKPTKLLIDDLLDVSVGESKSPEDNKKSYYLGYVERIFAFITVLTSTYLAISVLIGFKTWAQSERLKSEDSDFPKRYLIGTIASMLIAVVLALLVLTYFQKNGTDFITIR